MLNITLAKFTTRHTCISQRFSEGNDKLTYNNCSIKWLYDVKQLSIDPRYVISNDCCRRKIL